MKIGLSFIFLFCLFSSNAQEDTTRIAVHKYCKIIRQQLEIDPVSIWYNKGISLGHRVKYTYDFFNKTTISVDINGTIFKSLDARLVPGKKRGVLPNLNQSQMIYEGIIRTHRTKEKGRIPGHGSFGLRGGYHYFQHATGANYHEYWSVDSLPQTGWRTIAGFYSHSILAGVSYELTRYHKFIERRKESYHHFKKSIHRISLDYLFSPFYQLKYYDSDATSNFNEEKVKSDLPVNRSGAQFQYHFSYDIRKRFGFHADFEALWVPFLKDYQPNYDFFVPRGSESIVPLFLNIRAGIYWKF